VQLVLWQYVMIRFLAPSSIKVKPKFVAKSKGTAVIE
jgi:hypothetical protein